MLSGWMGVSPELRVEVTFLMTFSSVNPVKIGDGHNMEAVEQAGYRPEAGSRFRFQGKMCSVPRFQRCQTCQFLVPALGHPLANMSHAGSSKFITKCRVLN